MGASSVEVEGVKHEKNEAEYNTNESSLANFNSKALNAIFGTVDENMFCLISTCTTAKHAWDTLQHHCEGSKGVCQMRLRLLAAKFETIRILENENISSYTAKLMNIANECYSLGESISNEKLVVKVMRSLPKRFNMMITALDVSKDVTTIRFDDLVGTLKTFEMNLESSDAPDVVPDVAPNVMIPDTTPDTASEATHISDEQIIILEAETRSDVNVTDRGRVVR
ncbi:Unknown protein [Striga hermonthica]|uniref:Gag-pol polyprotein n=1 Tax=Striga hermonthica TaxID=68872 RepID=A0A9N7R7B3_STRHE|nr:Unknown protein [Striga hermonthica]